MEAAAELIWVKEELVKKSAKNLSDLSIHNQTLENLEDYISSLSTSKIVEMNNLENLQTWFYAETVKMASMGEDIDKMIIFISEFIMKGTIRKKKCSDDFDAFHDLSPED